MNMVRVISQKVLSASQDSIP